MCHRFNSDLLLVVIALVSGGMIPAGTLIGRLLDGMVFNNHNPLELYSAAPKGVLLLVYRVIAFRHSPQIPDISKNCDRNRTLIRINGE